MTKNKKYQFSNNINNKGKEKKNNKIHLRRIFLYKNRSVINKEMIVSNLRRLEERLLKIAEIYDRFGVPYPKRDKSEIKATAMSRKDNTHKRNDIINQDQVRLENKKERKKRLFNDKGTKNDLTKGKVKDDEAQA
ncbi:hypothetical protein GLOIN_2v1844702 [Rhizophagus clarus]|uniref:Uncharacterized protein n=1 Tax=Rhizophagus clarus TaxID=94130 RepID=A0A8H3KSE2_9GLOM|nr:hypothetical protein GLOIN_2v1844702 [Rhizophagus clarus]